MISFSMRRAGWGLLAAALLTACGGGGGGGGGGSDGGGTTYSLPDYTIAVLDGDAPVVNADGSHYFADHTHIQLDETITGSIIRMTVTGVFNASRVYPVILASSLGTTTDTDGWVLKFDRGFSGSTVLDFRPCFEEICTNMPTPFPFEDAYSVGSAFALTVEVDCSSDDIVRAWADTPYGGVGTHDYETITALNATGNLLGMSIHGATIRSIQVTQQ